MGHLLVDITLTQLCENYCIVKSRHFIKGIKNLNFNALKVIQNVLKRVSYVNIMILGLKSK